MSVEAVLPPQVSLTNATPAAGTSFANGIWSVGNLDTFESVTLQLTGTIAADAAGTLTASAAITGADQSDPNPDNNSDEAIITLIQPPGISVSVSTSVDEAQPGDTITYTYDITNTGGYALTLSLEDDLNGSISLPVEVLNPGNTTSGAANYVVSGSDLPGPLLNTGIASGTTAYGQTVTDQATSSITLSEAPPPPDEPALSLTLNTSADEAQPGDTITYTFNIVNTGNVLISSLGLTDSLLGDITLPVTALDPDASTSVAVDYLVSGDDLPGPLVNNATVSGQSPSSEPVSDDASASVILIDPTPPAALPVRPVLECVLINYDDVGGIVDYTARFGYLNENAENADIPIGDNNFFNIPPADRGQPETFLPGRQVNVFSFNFDGSNIVWTLEGPDESRRTSTASAGGPACADQPPPPTPPDTPDTTIEPILECVVALGDNTFRARFGYNNPNLDDGPIHIPAGENNHFSPGGPDRGQATSFAPGLRVPMFEVTFTDPAITWTLTSPNGQTRTVTADANTQRCDEPPSVDGPDDQAIQPIAECVVDLGGGSFRARFGYNNPNTDRAPINIPAGENNHFSPGGPDRGQATTFSPGHHSSVFEVTFSDPAITWTLTLPNGQSASTTADANTQRCDAPPVEDDPIDDEEDCNEGEDEGGDDVNDAEDEQNDDINDNDADDEADDLNGEQDNDGDDEADDLNDEQDDDINDNDADDEADNLNDEQDNDGDDDETDGEDDI